MVWSGKFLLEGSTNARDVGGLPTTDGRQVRDGVLLRSANLQYLSPAAVTVLLTDKQVRRIVDLRTDVEVLREGPGPMTRESQVTIHNLSLYHDKLDANGELVMEQVTEEMVGDEPGDADGGGRPDVLTPWQDRSEQVIVADDPIVNTYLKYLRRRPDSIVSALRVIAEPDGATLVHCAAGKDRTGVVVALALDVAGVDRAAIADDYAETAVDLSAVIDLLARSDTYRRDVEKRDEMPIPEPSVMQRVFAAVEAEYGGVLPYLIENGWTVDDTDRLRRRLVD